MDKSKQNETPLLKNEKIWSFLNLEMINHGENSRFVLSNRNYGLMGCDFRKLFKMWVP